MAYDTDDWWPGFSGSTLNAGVIARVDLDIDTNNHFQLELDKERGVFYAMRYDAVVRFADETHHSFSSYRLPAHALHNPADDVFVVMTTMMTMMNMSLHPQHATNDAA